MALIWFEIWGRHLAMAWPGPPLPYTVHSTVKSGVVTPRIDAYVDMTVYHCKNACLCTYHQHYFSSLFREALTAEQQVHVLASLSATEQADD